jgi:hypothetical protein
MTFKDSNLVKEMDIMQTIDCEQATEQAMERAME